MRRTHEETQSLRAEIRAFLSAQLPKDYEPGLGMAAGHDPTFSRMLAERGWVGMAIPLEYGGHGRSAVERFVVAEELLSAGAPVNAHWIADRQIGPSILRFGNEEQKREFLPRIAKAECFFSLGMSEPDSGSDLASVRTTARQAPGGWLVSGRKVWTSGAHLNHFLVALCRTDPSADRKAGLSQLIIDLSAEGVQVRPIPILDGSSHFNEVTLDDVFVSDERVLGDIGAGWLQVTSELAHERAGPDRYLSTFQLVVGFLRDELGPDVSPEVTRALGLLAARYWALMRLGLSVAAAIDQGKSPQMEAAVLKDVGTSFEQHVVTTIRDLTGRAVSLDSSTPFERLLARAILTGPSFTLRGGTTEILRMMAGRRLLDA